MTFVYEIHEALRMALSAQMFVVYKWIKISLHELKHLTPKHRPVYPNITNDQSNDNVYSKIILQRITYDSSHFGVPQEQFNSKAVKSEFS